ncbi:unnamed protein product [Meganyctiphanes norvegica]|uniref:Z-binding domain-containing protein n=1 Tax=Meganyctiphanes norvegica TaxID=48144 RepID=A0AAV2QX12_MEGNR
MQYFIIVCIVLLKGVPVADKFVGLSNGEKKRLGFNADQIRHIESGWALDKMDISILDLIIRAFGGLSPGHLTNLLKQFKDKRNDYIHEKQNLSLDKKTLKAKLAELKAIYKSILEVMKYHCDPAEIPRLNLDIAEMETQMSLLENTVDDHLQEKTEALRRAAHNASEQMTQSAATLNQNICKSTRILDQTVAKVSQLEANINKTVSDLDDKVSEANSTLEQATSANNNQPSINIQNLTIIENNNIVVPPAQLSLNDPEACILQHLSTAKAPMNSLDIAKAVGFETSSKVNPTLYKLMKENKIQKVSESPPLWKIGEQQVLGILRESSESVSTKSLVKSIGLPKANINKTLYDLQNKGLVKKVGDVPPFWEIKEN